MKEINKRLAKQWASAIVQHEQWQGVFSTGWPVPGADQSLHDQYHNILPSKHR
eukprot:COSAG04_NODE_6358_length_1348_cov_2.626101_1_plen_52_part_10